MARSLLVFGALALAGAVFNLATAWLSVWLNAWLPVRSQAIVQYAQADPLLYLAWEQQFGPSIFLQSYEELESLESARQSVKPGAQVFMIVQSTRCSMGVTQTQVTDRLRPVPFRMLITKAGWPIRSFYSIACTRGNSSFVRGGLTVNVVNPQKRYQQAYLPYAPMPIGFAANTALWGLLIAAAVFGWNRLRTLWRVANGRCTRCGYDIKGTSHNVCPECGTSASAIT